MALTLDRLNLTWGSYCLEANLSLPDGGFFAMLGPSGAGKSTLLSAIAGFTAPSSGTIAWDGQEISALPPWLRPVAILFQDSNLFPHLSIAQNAALALDPRGRANKEQLDQVEAMLESVGLAGLGLRKPAELSGGQQSRAALARLLLQDRPLTLLDEPFAALGPGLKDEMLALAAERLNTPGRTVILVTHDPDEARQVASSLIFVDGGRVHPPAPISSLDNPHPALAAYLGQPCKGP